MWECLLSHAKCYFSTLPVKTLKLHVSSVVLLIFYRCGLVYVGSPLVWIIIIIIIIIINIIITAIEFSLGGSSSYSITDKTTGIIIHKQTIQKQYK
jgi:hypothetical protein